MHCQRRPCPTVLHCSLWNNTCTCHLWGRMSPLTVGDPKARMTLGMFSYFLVPSWGSYHIHVPPGTSTSIFASYWYHRNILVVMQLCLLVWSTNIYGLFLTFFFSLCPKPIYPSTYAILAINYLVLQLTK